jgi:hypothetical protein
MLGDGTGYFSTVGIFPISGGFAPDIVAADFNLDGKADMAWADLEAAVVDVLLSNGDGTFQAARSFAPGGNPITVAVADLNGDSNPDLVTSNVNGYYGSVFLGNGDGTFRAAQNYGGGTVGDFNGDGSLDVGVGNNHLLLGNGNDAGTFPAGGGDSTLGDFNGDGRWDIASAGHEGNSVLVSLNDGIWDVGPPPPAMAINDVSVVEGNIGTVAATFTVSLSFASTETVTVAYATADGNATAGSDYQAASGTVTFAPGETSKTITVLVTGDRLPEPTETFAVNLSAATNATITDGQGTGTILDNEPRISISDVSKKEGKKNQTTQFTFTVTLSAAYDQAVTVSFQTVNGTATTGDNDYVARTGTLTFAPGETTKTITIDVKGDNKREANETFYVDLFGNSGNSLFSKNRGIGTILNDD